MGDTGMPENASRGLREYWQELVSDGKIPSKNALDPMAMKAFLGNIALLDIVRDPLDFRFRLVGEHIQRGANTRLKGRLLREWAEQEQPRAAALLDSCLECVRTTHPQYFDRFFTAGNAEWRNICLVLPLLDKDDIGHLLVGCWYEQKVASAAISGTGF